MSMDPAQATIETVGPYVLHDQIAQGGMATIHIARLIGDEGFSRIVAVKRMLPQFAEDAEFVSMFIDEAKIASKVHHQNVVRVLDVVTTGGEVILVQEYVHGVPLNTLLGAARQAGIRVPISVAVSIASQILTGLHAAHETVGPGGNALHIVHRDISPGNMIVSVDGTALLLDFGVAKATMAAHITRAGTFKGKRTYSSPEQLRGKATQQSDLYSMAVVLWELLVGDRLHPSRQGEAEMVEQVISGRLPTVTEALADERDQIDDARWHQLRALEPVVLRGLDIDLACRYQTAAEMDAALVATVRPASTVEVATWTKLVGKHFLESRDQILAEEAAGWRAKSTQRARTRMPEPRSPRDSQQLSELRTMPVPVVPPEPALPDASRTNRMIKVLAALVVVLSIAIVLAARRNSSGSTTTAPSVAKPAPIEPSARDAARLAAPIDGSEHLGIARLAAPIDTAARMPERAPEAAAPAPVLDAPGWSWPRAAAGWSWPRIEPGALRPAPVKREQPKATRPKAATAPAIKKRVNCSPPYYFKASKKIFKPACL